MLQVSGMEELFGSLRSDVEAVFMQAPTVQLEAVATKVEAMSPRLEELVSGSLVSHQLVITLDWHTDDSPFHRPPVGSFHQQKERQLQAAEGMEADVWSCRHRSCKR